MAETMTTNVGRTTWVDLNSSDAAASRDFYAQLFGWNVAVNPDPQYGGYAVATLGGSDAAGIGPKMDPNAPTAWNVYIGTDDVDATTAKVEPAGGHVLMQPMDVGDQGRMAVYADPTGGVISAWQGARMRGFQTDAPNAFGWAELNARGVDKALPFYSQVFGWGQKASEIGNDQGTYTEFLDRGESIAGATEMPAMVPAQVPTYWLVYFDVTDVDATHQKAISLGATETVPPQEFPGGRFSIVNDPQGAAFGLLRLQQA